MAAAVIVAEIASRALLGQLTINRGGLKGLKLVPRLFWRRWSPPPLFDQCAIRRMPTSVSTAASKRRRGQAAQASLLHAQKMAALGQLTDRKSVV